MTNDDLLVISKFKNLRLQEYVDMYGSARQLALAADVSESELSYLLNLRKSPWTDERKPRVIARKLAALLGADVNELFPASLYQLTIPAEVRRTFESEKVLSLQEAQEQKLLPEVISTEAIEDNVLQRELHDQLHDVMNTLTPKYARVLELRYGLNGEDPRTLEEAAEIVGVSKERVRQIENAALRRLRHPARSKQLRAFL